MTPESYRIALEGFRVDADIGFHDFEVGAPQPLCVTIEIWLDPGTLPVDDKVAEAWDYDFLRIEIAAMVAGRRYNLQETLAAEIFALVAARPGVLDLRVTTSKPDVYPDCDGVGVELASFAGGRAHGPTLARTKA